MLTYFNQYIDRWITQLWQGLLPTLPSNDLDRMAFTLNLMGYYQAKNPSRKKRRLCVC